MRQIFPTIFCLIFATCQPSNQPAAGRKLSFAPADFLAKSPAEVFDFAKKLPAAEQDSLYFFLFSNLEKADKHSLELEQVDFFEKLRGTDPDAQLVLQNTRANALVMLGNYDSAIVLNQKVLAEAQKRGDQRRVAEAAYPLGMAFRLQGNYAKCTENYLHAMQAAAAVGDSMKFNIVQIEQAAVRFLTKDFGEAIAAAQRGLPFFEKMRDSSMLGYTHTILGLANAELGNLDAALRHHDQSLAFNRAARDERGIAESLNNMSIVLRKQQKWQEAIRCLETALPMMLAAEDFRNVSILRGNLGLCYQKMGRLAEAWHCFEASAAEQKSRGQLHDAAFNAGRLANLAAEKSDFKSAFQFLQEQRDLLDSVFQKEKTRDFNEFNVKFETTQKEHQIAKLEAEKRAGHLFFGLVIAAVLLLAGAIGFLFYRLRQRQKLLEKEGEIQRKNLEINQLELDFNRQELEKTALRLAEKNRLVETLHANLDALQTDLAARAVSDDHPAPLAALYDMKILTDDDWSEFRAKFERVFPNFMARLRVDFPALTEAELRLAMLLRMDIRPREIAAMLGVSPDSVGKTRYRLRKKLGLGEETSLEAFVLGR